MSPGRMSRRFCRMSVVQIRQTLVTAATLVATLLIPLAAAPGANATTGGDPHRINQSQRPALPSSPDQPGGPGASDAGGSLGPGGGIGGARGPGGGPTLSGPDTFRGGGAGARGGGGGARGGAGER